MVETINPVNEVSKDTPEAREYSRKQRWLGIADTTVSFAVLVVVLATGWTVKLRDLSFKLPGGSSFVIALFYYIILLTGIAKLAGAALDYYGFRLEHQYHLSNQKFGSWISDQLKGWVVGIVLGTIVAEIVYYTIRAAGDWWWVLAWVFFMGLFVLLAQLAPVVLFPLFYKFVPLENEELKARLVRLSERAGTKVRGVYEWKLSEKSKKANAALTGLGNTRRIILADTLLENYTHDEIEAVLAHELGHHVHRHIFKSIAVQAMVTLLGFWLANLALDYSKIHMTMFADLHDFANLPLLALASTGLSLVLLPALNAYSRFNEREADQYCWKSVANVQPFISAMKKLSQQNLTERDPSRIVEILFHSHPAVSKRIAAAAEYEKKAIRR